MVDAVLPEKLRTVFSFWMGDGMSDGQAAVTHCDRMESLLSWRAAAVRMWGHV